MHPRYFIGLDLPSDISEAIESARIALLAGHPVMQPLVPHITLIHPGALTSVSPMYFVPQVQQLAAGYLPLNVKLTETGLFDRRVLHLTVQSPGLHDLHAALLAALPEQAKNRYDPGRTFTPHVTVAQSEPRMQLSDELIDKLTSKLQPLLPYEFKATQVHLFQQVKPRQYEVRPV